MAMKKRISLWVGVSVLLMTAAASAQTTNAAVVTVPFDFVAGNKQFSAGTYDIVKRGYAVSLRDPDGKFLGYLGTHPAETLDAATADKIVFYEVDGRHFLARVWFAGDNQGVELIRPGTETEVARKFTKSGVMQAANNAPADKGK
jgi:hypothetical protein